MATTSEPELLPEFDEHRLPQLWPRNAVARVVFGTVIIVSFTVGVLAMLTTVKRTIQGYGYLEHAMMTPVRASASGRLVRLFVKAGDFVSKSQLVAVLDTLPANEQLQDLDRRIAASRIAIAHRDALAEVALARADAEIERADASVLRARANLRSHVAQSGLKEDIDSVLAHYQRGSRVGTDQVVADAISAQADARAARIALILIDADRFQRELALVEIERLELQRRSVLALRNRLNVLAPDSGIVVTDTVHRIAGSLVQEGAPLFQVAGRGAWHAIIGVSERDIHRIRLADSVIVIVPALASSGADQFRGIVVGAATEAKRDRTTDLGNLLTTPYWIAVRVNTTNTSPHPESLRRGFRVEGRIAAQPARVGFVLLEYLRERASTWLR